MIGRACRARPLAVLIQVMRVVPPLACLALLAGCDALAGRDFVGEPMFTLRGTVLSRASANADGVEGIALMWQDASGAGGPGVAVTTVPIAIEFPAQFRATVPVPPPDAARFSFGDAGVALAEAYVYVVADAGAPRPAPLGVDRAHVLVYASGDVAAGTLAADYLGGPLAAGYHLRRFTPVQAPGPAQQGLIERCAGVAPRHACEVRRAYQLAATGDDEPLRIVVDAP